MTEVLIVGGGPAGATLARLLARNGHDTTVVDRDVFPRPKPCGESLNPGAVRLLDRLDVLPDVQATKPGPMNGWHVADADGASMTGCFTGQQALGITRETFDDILLGSATAAGASVYQDTRITKLERTGSGWRVWGRDGERERAWTSKYLVGADGLRSVVARHLGLVTRGRGRPKASWTFRISGTGPDRARGHLRVSAGGTLGLAPVHEIDPRWNCTVVVPAGAPARALAERPDEFVLQALGRGWSWTSGPRVDAKPLTCGPFDWPNRSATAEGALLIGDAAGYFDPFTGQGIFRALRSAELAFHALLAPSPASFARYNRTLRRELHAPRALQRVIDAALHPDRSRRIALSAVGRCPRLANRIVEVVGDVRPVRSLFNPLAFLGGTP